MNGMPLSWMGIVRLGLVQAALGSIVVLTTSTMNRVMVVERALPASLSGLLVGLHYAIQLLRPRLGYGSDIGVAPALTGDTGVAYATVFGAEAVLFLIAAVIALRLDRSARSTSWTEHGRHVLAGADHV